MGTYNRSFTTMGGYLDRMKAEADRKAEEEQRKKQEEERRLAQWRRDASMLPQPKPSMSDMTRGNAEVSKPLATPTLKPQTPSPSPLQVGHTEPTVNTGTPEVQSSMVTGIGAPEDYSARDQQDHTVTSGVNAMPTVRPQYKPPVIPGLNAFPEQTAQVAPANQWNPSVSAMGAPNTGLAQPMAPQLLPELLGPLAKVAGGAVNDLAKNWNDINWSEIDWRTGLPTLKDFIPLEFGQKVPGPVQTAVDLTAARMEQRHQERKYTSVAPTTIIQHAGNVVGSVTEALLNIMDIAQLGSDLVGVAPINTEGNTFGQLYAMTRDVGQQMVSDENLQGSGWLTSMVGVPNTPENEAILQNTLFGQVSNLFVWTNPKAWSNISQVATYWDIANKKLDEALIPTDAQLKFNSPERVKQATNLAILNSISGLQAMGDTFDNYLNNAVTSAELSDKANKMVQMAEMAGDDTVRIAVLSEAGRIGSEAVRLREQTPLEVYDKNINYWNALPFWMLFDPVGSWGAASELAGLSPAARRAKQGLRLAEMPIDAPAGSNKTILDTVKQLTLEWMETQRSKAVTDKNAAFSVIGNVLSAVTTKGDVAVTLKSLFAGTIGQGVPLDQLNGADAILQGVDGVVPFGWAGINDFRWQEAAPAFRSLVDQVDNFPSLVGEATEIVNRFELQGDILGALTRAAAVNEKVSVLGEVPWGTTRFRVKATGQNKAVIEYLADAKTSIGQSVEMSLAEATKHSEDLTKALAKGEEFRTNWVKKAGDLRRSIMSTYTINISGGSIIGNAVSGNLMGMVDRGFDMEFFKPVATGIDYLTTKMGGFFPESRLAEGAGNIMGSVRSASQTVMPTGQYDNWFGKILNWSTLGLAKKGRDIRQGVAEIGGIKVGEEAMATSIYYAAFKSFFEQEWERAVGPMVSQLLENRVTNPQTAKWVIDQIIQAGVSGGRVDVAKTFQQIADGRIAVSLRSISPVIGDILTREQALELDDLFRNLNQDTVGTVAQRVQDIFAERRTLLSQEYAKWLNDVNPTFTSLDDAKDVANLVNELENAAQLSGRNVDEAKQAGERLRQLQENINNNLLAIMQMSQNNPNLSNYIMNVWGQLRDAKDIVRRTVGTRQAEVFTQFGHLPPGMQGPTQAPTAATQAFNDLFVYTNEQWDIFGREAQRIMNVARQEIADGTALRWVQSRVGNTIPGVPSLDPNFPMTEMDALNFITDLEIDPTVALDILKRPISAKDPAFAENLKIFRQAVDVVQQHLFAMVMRYPNMRSMDVFNDTFKAVANERYKVIGKLQNLKNQLEAAQLAGDNDLIRRLSAQLANTGKHEWNKWWKYAIERYQVGAYQVAEANFDTRIMDQLVFTRQGVKSGQQWRLIGPDIHKPNLWVVENLTDGKITRFPKGNGFIPEDVINKWNEIRNLAHTEFMEQVGRLATQSGADPTAIDEALSKLGGSTMPELLKTVRSRVAEAMAAYQNPQVIIPADLPQWYMGKLNASEQGILQSLTEIAQMNAQGHGRLDLSAMADFNRNILPMYDNIITGAQRYAQEMLSMGMVDFSKTYHPDVLLGLYAPYHYWWSRMLKNVLERQIFDPRVGQALFRTQRAIENQNRQENQPNRNLSKFPGGVQVGQDTFNTGLNLLWRWIPWTHTMAMNGWANPDRANRSYDYMLEAAKEQNFPATAKTAAGSALFWHEMANQFGLSSYPEYDLVMDWLAGDPLEAKDFQGFMGETSSLHRTLGYGAVRFANWARDNNHPLMAQLADNYAWATNPDYVQSLYSREAALRAAQGKYTDAQAGMVQDIARQEFSGIDPMPEQGIIDPQAMDKYRDVQNKVALEYFVRGLISWVTGAPIAAEYGKETEMRDAQDAKRRMDYEPSGNTAGSQAAYFSSTNPSSPNFVPGLLSYENRYKATMEVAPQMPADVDRPGESVVTARFWEEYRAINEKYQAEETAAYEAHPEWSTADKAARDAKKKFDTDLKERKQAEQKALQEKFPSVEMDGEKTAWSLYGARPSETMLEAQERLTQLAYDNVESKKPADGAPNSAWQAYYAALEAELTRLMNDPQAASDVVFNRALPMTNQKQAGPTPDVLRGPYGAGDNVPTPTSQPVQPAAAGSTAPTTSSAAPAAPAAPATATVHPDNQWAEQMAAAEQQYGLPSGVLQALARRESNFTPAPSNGYGMMQIENATWKDIVAANPNLTDREDPEQAILAAAYYLDWVNKQLEPGKKDDLFWIIAGYNMGVGAVNAMTGEEDILNYVHGSGKARLDYVKDIVASSGTPVTTEMMSNPTQQQFIRPVDGGSELVTQGYGANVESYREWNGEHGHEGIDYGVPVGTPVKASAGGTVVFVGSGNGFDNYGKYVVIDHGNGYKSYYGHLSGFDVKEGDTVEQGQLIAKSGNTGNSTGPHLHFALRKDGDTSGPYGMVDPTDFILGKGGVSVAPTATNETQTASVSPTVSKPPADGVAWSKTPQELIAESRQGSKTDARVAAEASVSAEFEAIKQRGISKYPKYAHLYDEFADLPETEREAWRAKNPMIKAIHLAAYNPDEWQTLETTFGEGIVEKWALIPPYVEGDETGARSDYYRKEPKVFLANAWINGRPEPYEERDYDPTKPYERDFGSDYEKAKELFGEGIWDIVEQYYRTPQYVKGGDNTAWIAFKEENPVFDEWREWWYALIDDGTEKKPFVPYGPRSYGSFGGFSGSGGYSSSGEHPQAVRGVEFRNVSPPEWSRGGSGGSDWRKYLQLGEVKLRNWRR